MLDSAFRQTQLQIHLNSQQLQSASTRFFLDIYSNKRYQLCRFSRPRRKIWSPWALNILPSLELDQACVHLSIYILIQLT